MPIFLKLLKIKLLQVRLVHKRNKSKKKLSQFTKLCKGDMSQHLKTAKWFWDDNIACWIPDWPLQD